MLLGVGRTVLAEELPGPARVTAGILITARQAMQLSITVHDVLAIGAIP